MTLPQPLDRFDLGEVLGHLRTAGQAPFLDASGDELAASLWFVVCTDRCWLLAATGDQTWCVADTSVRLDKGWTWDAVVVGRWSAPLRARTRKDAEALLRLWKKADQGGRPVAAPVSDPPLSIAPVARGAAGMPEWSHRVLAPSEAHWLLGFQTGRGHPSVGRDGAIHREPVWMLLSDRHQVLATESGWIREVTALTVVERTARRDVMVADGWSIPGPGLSEPYTALAAKMAAGGPSERWRDVLGFLIDRQSFDEASRLLAHAYLVQRHESSWDAIGQLALATDHPEQAVLAVRELLRREPELDLRAAAVRWLKSRPSGAEPVPAGVFADVEALVLPEGLPWPLEGALEVFGTAAVLAGREQDGLALWAHRGRSPRALQAAAAVAARDGADQAVELWVEAAERWRAEDTDKARSALAHALVVADAERSPELHWTLGAWCDADGVDGAAHWRLAVREMPPDALVQPVQGWRAAAAVAEQENAAEVAACCWSKVWAIDVFEREAVLRTARLAEEQLGDPARAMAALLELEARSEDVPEPDPPLYDLRLEICRLAMDANDTTAAEAALRRAVEGDFLSLEAWNAALKIGSTLLHEDEIRWFEHVRDCLSGATTTGCGPLRSTLDAGALDALHPGGVGWLERARQSVDAAAPPERTELIRGLERMQPERWPVLSSAVDLISGGLGVDAPDVYLFRGEGAWGLSVWPTEPPLVLVGHDHLEEGHLQGMTRDALRFALAVELTHLAAGHPLLAFDGGLVGTSRSVYEAFGKYAGTAETVVDVVTLLPGVDQIAKIQTLIKLSRRVFTARSVVEKASGITSSSLGFLGWSTEETQTVGRSFDGVALQFRLQADRAALLLTGDLQAAVEAILASDPGAAVHRQAATERGVLSVLEVMPPDARLRVASLVGFAATLTLPEPG